MQSARLTSRALFGLLSVTGGCETTTPRKPPAQTASAMSTSTARSRADATKPHPVPAASRDFDAELPPKPSPPLASSAAAATSSAPSVSGVQASSPPRSRRATACNVALVGDSLTDFRVHGGGYVRYLEQHCPASHFENFAKGGAMVNQMRRWFEEHVVPEPHGTFTHVVVFGGVNDLYSDETAGRTTSRIEADLSAIYGEAKAHGARVVALTVAPWGGFTRYFTPHRAETTRELNAWILAAPARGTVDVTVDAHALLGCGDPDKLCERYENARSDGLHFGREGHEVLGRALYDAEFSACP